LQPAGALQQRWGAAGECSRGVQQGSAFEVVKVRGRAVLRLGKSVSMGLDGGVGGGSGEWTWWAGARSEGDQSSGSRQH